METWSFLSGGKGLTFVDEMDLHIDEYPRNTKPLNGFEQKPFYCFEQNMEFTDTNFTEMERRPLYSYSSGQEILTFQDQEESGSSISNAFLEANGPNSSFFDLKLGRVTDLPRTQLSVVSDVSVALPAKRARTAQNQIATPMCQVYGCNKDLSSSKDYHKRHKVCDVHSKTATVIVNGVEQRFCQQCSRFHLLSEFDDGKRSCRRRLAGHNERRRKSHLHGLTGKPHRLHRPSQGVPGTSAKNPNFLPPEAYTAGILYAEGGPELLNPNGHAPRTPFLRMQGTDYLYVPNASCEPSAFQEVSGVSPSSPSSAASCCAFSLLSTKPRNSQIDATIQNSEQMFEIEYPFQKSFTGRNIQSLSCLYSTKPSGSAHPVQILDLNPSHSPEKESTVDLIQLSSHLRRVEQQRNSFNVIKQEDPTSLYFLHNGRRV